MDGRMRVLVGLVAAFVASAPGAAGEPPRRMESARLGVAPEAYRGMTLRGGVAEIAADGGGYAEFKYAAPGSDRPGGRSLLVRALWAERAREGKQRRLFPRVDVGGSSDGTFSASHQVPLVDVTSGSPRRRGRRGVRGPPPRAVHRRRPRGTGAAVACRPPRLQPAGASGGVPPRLHDAVRRGRRRRVSQRRVPVRQAIGPRGDVLPRAWRLGVKVAWQEQALLGWRGASAAGR